MLWGCGFLVSGARGWLLLWRPRVSLWGGGVGGERGLGGGGGGKGSNLGLGMRVWGLIGRDARERLGEVGFCI